MSDPQLRTIDEAWLKIDVDDSSIFNPMEFLNASEDDYHLKLTWLMTRPEYFSFICKHIFNIQLLPSQSLMLYELWNRRFPMLIASRGFGKSFILSLYCLMRALLLPRRKVIIVGAAFRQSKVLFEYMETIWNNAPLLRDCCDSNSGPRRDIDRCMVRVNESRVIALPLGDGSKIRGQRAHDIISDEFACLKSGSIVEGNNGFVRIEDFDRVSAIRTGDDLSLLEFPEKFIKTPKTDVFEIKLQNGYVIRCSRNHKVMTNKGWKKPLELTEEHYIEKSDNRCIFSSSNPLGLDERIAWLMGVLVSEGCITDKKRISITTTDINLCSKLINNFSFKFNIRKAHINGRGWSCKESYALYLDDEELRNKLCDLGLDYCTAHDKIVPWSILKAKKSTILQFLSGLFDGDGSCFLWQDRETENKIGLAYYSVSERLCRDVQFLAERLGYDGYINSRKSKISENLQWFVRWNNNNAKNFAVDLQVDRFKDTIKNCITTEEPSYITWDKSRKKWKVQYGLFGTTIQKRFKKRTSAERFVLNLKEKDRFRKVVSVTKLNKKEHLYDYYLPITNSFYAEGHRQHNSIPREIFETVVAGFAAVSADPIENVKRLAAEKKAEELGVNITRDEDSILRDKTNQIILSGTAYYDFNHFAEYWKRWKSIILSRGDPNKLVEIFGSEDIPENFDWRDYSVMRIPYELLPEGFMDASQVARSKATMHTGIYQMEFGAVFTKDSEGFFRRTLIESCVSSEKEPICNLNGEPIIFEAQLMGDNKKRYVFGVDPASEVDNFSIVVLELNPDHRRIVYCWTTTRTEHKEKVKKGYVKETDFYSYCARKIRDLMRLFPCVHVAMDAQGGGVAVMEALHDTDKYDESKGEMPIWEVIDEDKEKDTDGERGLHILEMCQFAKHDWLAEANHGLRKDFEDKVTLFPLFDAVTLGVSYTEDQVRNRMYDTLEECVMEIEELKDELAMIQMSQTPAGRDKWDTPEVIVAAGKKDKLRKDRYSALLMANMASRIIMRTPTPADYSFYGGFARSSDTDQNNSNPNHYSGPAWFTEQMNDIY